jgi:hypothetical protein
MTAQEAINRFQQWIKSKPFGDRKIITWRELRRGFFHWQLAHGQEEMSNVTLGKIVKKLGYNRNLGGKEADDRINIVYLPEVSRAEKVSYWESVKKSFESDANFNPDDEEYQFSLQTLQSFVVTPLGCIDASRPKNN